MLKVYYGDSDYAKYDHSVCQWNQFLKDFCADENSLNYSNKLKLLLFFGKKLKIQEWKNLFKESLTEYADRIKDYCK